MEVNIHFERFLILLFIAGLVAMITRRLRVPYTVGLLCAGIILSLHSFFFDVPFTRDLVFNVFLPPLVFEAALQMRWTELRKDLPVVLLLATAGVCLSWALTALGMRYLAGWEWAGALLFGILIAATDPVSVIATFEEAGVHGRLRLLVESESLLNDGTAAVGFGIILAVFEGGSFSAGGIATILLATAGGGILCGAITAGVMIVLARRTPDHLVQIIFTTFAAYASFILAERYHFSGVLASLTAGMIVGNAGPLGKISPHGREAVAAYWEFLGFLPNALIFMGIGIQLSRQNFAGVLLPAIIAIPLVTAGRAMAVYPCCAVFSRAALRVKRQDQHILFWGGLRGALALALAIGLPSSVPRQEMIVSVTFAVVAFSVFAQGLTMTPLLRRMGEIPVRI